MAHGPPSFELPSSMSSRLLCWVAAIHLVDADAILHFSFCHHGSSPTTLHHSQANDHQGSAVWVLHHAPQQSSQVPEHQLKQIACQAEPNSHTTDGDNGGPERPPRSRQSTLGHKEPTPLMPLTFCPTSLKALGCRRHHGLCQRNKNQKRCTPKLMDGQTSTVGILQWTPKCEPNHQQQQQQQQQPRRPPPSLLIALSPSYNAL